VKKAIEGGGPDADVDDGGNAAPLPAAGDGTVVDRM
jgi:hypothetical protein